MSKFSLRIFLLLVISTAILGFVAYLVAGNIQNLIAQNAVIDHSNQVLVKLSRTVAKFREAQSYERGYLLTHDPAYLTRYKSIGYTVEGALLDLQSAVSADSDQQARVTHLMELTRNQMAQMDSLAALYDGQGPAAALEKFHIPATITDNDAIAAIAGQIESAARAQLNNLRSGSSHGLMTTVVVGASGMLTCIAIFLFLFWLIDREGARRSKSETSLQEIVNEMERIQHEMQQMGSLTDYLQSCREIEEIYKLVEQHLAPLLPGVSGALGVYNNSRNVIEVVASWGDAAPNHLEEEKYFLPEDCWALRRGAIHGLGDRGHEPRCPHLDEHVGEAICFPMVAHGETIGVLSVTAPTAGHIDGRMQRLLRSVSEHVSMAIANMRLEKSLRMQSLRDPLTQLYNRRYMETSLEREIFRAKRKKDPVSIIMIDVDHFKRFNDSFGHEAGDYVLQEFSKMLLKFIRGEDIACRYGGEEFILILPGCALSIAMERAEKLRAAMAQNHMVHNGVSLGTVTLSIGVLCYPEHSEDLDELVKKADEALYRAKHGGRNRVEMAQA